MKIKKILASYSILFLLMACDSGWTEVQEQEYKNDCNELEGTTNVQCDCAFENFSKYYSYNHFKPNNENLFLEQEVGDAIRIDKEIRKCFD